MSEKKSERGRSRLVKVIVLDRPASGGKNGTDKMGHAYLKGYNVIVPIFPKRFVRHRGNKGGGE